MSASFSAWYSEVRPEVPGCPVKAIDQALLAAAIEFCQKTKAWQQTFESFTYSGGSPVSTTVAGVDTYTLDGMPTGSEVSEILDCYGYYQRILGASDRTLTYYPTWVTDQGISAYVKLIYPNQIQLIPKPSVANSDTLRVIAVLKPSRTAANLPDIFSQPYFDGLRAGAIARLLMKRGAPWYDPQTAAVHKAAFIADIRRGIHDVQVGRVGAVPQIGVFA